MTKQLVGSRGPFYLRLAKINVFHKAAVIKDPIGILLAEYLHLNFGVKPVIVIKHPVSLIASLKRVNWWPHPCELADDQLIEDYFCDEADFMDRSWSTPMLASAPYWRALHKVLLWQASNYPNWQVVTHEQLCQNPVPTFKRLYEVLDLPWSESVKRRILKLTQSNRSTEARKGVVQGIQRNSVDIFEKRRSSLSIEERRAIFEVCKDVVLQVYSKESFGI